MGEDDVCERQAGMAEVFMDNASGLRLRKSVTKFMNA